MFSFITKTVFAFFGFCILIVCFLCISFRHSGNVLYPTKAMMSWDRQGSRLQKPMVKPVKPTVHEVADELYNDQLIFDRNNFSIQLNQRQLIINGVQQTEALQQILLKKFQKLSPEKTDINIKCTNHLVF